MITMESFKRLLKGLGPFPQGGHEDRIKKLEAVAGLNEIGDMSDKNWARMREIDKAIEDAGLPYYYGDWGMDPSMSLKVPYVRVRQRVTNDGGVNEGMVDALRRIIVDAKRVIAKMEETE